MQADSPNSNRFLRRSIRTMTVCLIRGGVTNGLNPHDATDRNCKTKSGYTALEVYLNSLCGETTDKDFVK